MKKGIASRTADFAAATRAVYNFRPERLLFHDAFALQLTSRRFRWIARSRFLRKFLWEPFMLRRLGSSLTILSRARYAEDHLKRAQESGVGQYVILGAGLDSFCLRYDADGPPLTIFEVDHPDTQTEKKARMKRAGLMPTTKTHFVPIDFASQSIAEILQSSELDFEKPAFVSWVGVIFYLPLEAIRETLQQLAGLLAPGSLLALDFMDKRLFDPEFLAQDAELEANLGRFFRFTAERGEPLLTGFSVEEMTALADQTGWRTVETMVGEDHTAGILPGEPDFLWPTQFVHLALLEKKAL